MSFHKKGEIFSMPSARVSVLFPLRMGMCKSSSLTVSLTYFFDSAVEQANKTQNSMPRV